jgi:hypothetical protein
MAAVDEVLTLIARRDFPSALAARRAARVALGQATGAELLTLYEAITHTLKDLLSELGEHGRQNEALLGFGLDIGWLDVQAIVDELVAAWREVERLRADGLTSKPFIDRYLSDWRFPIGSPDWLKQTRLAIAHRDSEWVHRVTARLRSSKSDFDDEDSDDEQS